jgi:hypothetical protein
MQPEVTGCVMPTNGLAHWSYLLGPASGVWFRTLPLLPVLETDRGILALLPDCHRADGIRLHPLAWPPLKLFRHGQHRAPGTGTLKVKPAVLFEKW